MKGSVAAAVMIFLLTILASHIAMTAKKEAWADDTPGLPSRGDPLSVPAELLKDAQSNLRGDDPIPAPAKSPKRVQHNVQIVEQTFERPAERTVEQAAGKYEVIIKKNLFYPLGKVDEVPKSSLVLVGIVGRRALIRDSLTGDVHYLSEGDIVGNIRLLEISGDSIVLAEGGKRNRLELKSNWSPLLTTSSERPKAGVSREQVARTVKQRRKSTSKGVTVQRKSQPRPSTSMPRSPGQPVMRVSFGEFLGERGVSMEEMQSNPDLRQEMEDEFHKTIMR